MSPLCVKTSSPPSRLNKETLRAFLTRSFWNLRNILSSRLKSASLSPNRLQNIIVKLYSQSVESTTCRFHRKRQKFPSNSRQMMSQMSVLTPQYPITCACGVNANVPISEAIRLLRWLVVLLQPILPWLDGILPCFPYISVLSLYSTIDNLMLLLWIGEFVEGIFRSLFQFWHLHIFAIWAWFMRFLRTSLLMPMLAAHFPWLYGLP